MQDPEQENLKQAFSSLFPTLSGEELEAAHRRFQRYVEFVWTIVEERFDRIHENPYAEITKVDSPTINQK